MQFETCYDKLLQQLSVDYNCAPADFRAREHILTLPALHAGRRSYSPGKPFLQMATLGGNAVIMADERLHPFLHRWSKGKPGHSLFELGSLLQLNEELKRYGYRMHPTHHMFLPCRDVKAQPSFRVQWLYEQDIHPFYGDPRFQNAIAFPAPCPVRPDRIAVLALDGDTIMGMAGCSEDAPHWQQIGIDVLPPYRARGIGSALVSLLKARIMETGDIPFYGTACANIQSQNIAIKTGFKPAWVETEAVKAEED